MEQKIIANSNHITRTFNETIVKGKIYSIEKVNGVPQMVCREGTITIKGKLDKAQATEKLEKANKGAMVEVESVHYIEELRGMSIEDFLKYSVPMVRPASQTKKEEEG